MKTMVKMKKGPMLNKRCFASMFASTRLEQILQSQIAKMIKKEYKQTKKQEIHKATGNTNTKSNP